MSGCDLNNIHTNYALYISIFISSLMFEVTSGKKKINFKMKVHQEHGSSLPATTFLEKQPDMTVTVLERPCFDNIRVYFRLP